MSKDSDFIKENKLQYGVVTRVYRKKGLVKVYGINPVEEYRNLQSFANKYENGELDKIKRKISFLPIDINRVRLRDTNSTELKALPVTNKLLENGSIRRFDKNTGTEIPRRKMYKTYKERLGKRKEDGPKDTPAFYSSAKTYKGENFEIIARQFLDRIKQKEAIEAKLILKDT